jgi:hypothetical protein
MSVTASAVRTVPVAPSLISVTLTLAGKDGKILRSLMGALTRAERRAAIRRNGGNKASANRGRFLVKEIIDALDAQGVTRLDEEPITPPDQQANRAAGRRSGSMGGGRF